VSAQFLAKKFPHRKDRDTRMAILRRQTSNKVDDQGPGWTFSGLWYHLPNSSGYWMDDTYTCSPEPGSSFSFNFVGSQAILFGGALNNTGIGNQWPAATYTVDGVSAGSQTPYFASDNISVIYFETQALANGSHTINGTITSGAFAVPYVIDYFYVNPPAGADNTGDKTTQVVPSSSGTAGSTTVIFQSTPIGAIVGGIVGGIAGIAILLFAAWYFLTRRHRDRRADYPASAGVDNLRAVDDSYRPEPFYAATASLTNSPLSSSIGKVPPMAQHYWDTQQPDRFRDSGMRFSGNWEQEVGPSQPPRTQGPPTYSPD